MTPETDRNALRALVARLLSDIADEGDAHISVEPEDVAALARAADMEYQADGARYVDAWALEALCRSLTKIADDATALDEAEQRAREADHRIRRLEAALRVCRGWVLTCIESPQAKRDLKTLDDALDRARIGTAGEGGGWQPIETAPKDGTDILAWCVHPNARYAGMIAGRSDWQAPVVTRWIDHNGGGWTWHGMVGSFTHWRPLPPPPATDARREDR